ncbi:MAG: HlyD family efflux transporter periplasmic adaptor subunit [Gammaproteobacteria bacterium]|nr:HlyD family efflux transporter periplasmic adaptor subunit [Gammaproteobacteria bacterium]
MNIENADTPIAHGRRKPLLVALSLVVLIAAVTAGVYYWRVARFFEHTDDAYVAANVVVITPQVSGTVRAVRARETQHVEAGQLLVELDEADTKIALEGAEADLARTVREVRTVYANNATLQADIAARRAEFTRASVEAAKASDDLATRASLVTTGAVGKEELKHAEASLNTAQAALEAARAGITAATERLASNRALTTGVSIDRHPTVARAAARVHEAYLAWTRTKILAPISGDVAQRAVQVGQRIQPGLNLMSLIPLDKVWVDANFKESQLRDMRIGQSVKLAADLYGGKLEYDGRIVGFGAGTGSAFALLPAQNATGNWIKIVQRVPVRIEIAHDQLLAHPLRVGLSMQVVVDIHQQDGATLRETPGIEHVSSTDVFEDTEGAATRRIAEIISSHLTSHKSEIAAAR